MEDVRMFELPCLDGHKSFYGKAHVLEFVDKTAVLISYHTKVASYSPDGTFTLYSDNDGLEKSRTTQRHIKSFKKLYNIN